MEKKKYGIIGAKKPEVPQRHLLRVPHKESSLVVGFPVFGPDTYKGNLKTMSGDYSHPQTGERISFREPTTSESISATAYDFENLVKPKIFDSRWLQAGRIVRTSEGVFVNPPKDIQGNPIIDEQTLKFYLNKSIKVNGIYLGENDFGFAPYETFERGIQDSEEFAEGGLARILEHTREKVAKNLKAISSSKNYPERVKIWGFDKVKEPVLRVAALDSPRGFRGGRLVVDGHEWYGDDGYAFGVLKDA